jgi:predicted dehydrogenase
MKQQAGAAVRFMTLDPGHFHAALVQKEMYPRVFHRADVFALLGPDLIAHLSRIAGFNARSGKPTAWELEVHAAADFCERMLADPPGNVVVLAGRNSRKIDYIQASVRAGLHVLADKPWILASADFPKLESSLADADARGVVAFDIMTERFEVTNQLQRALVHDRAVFGEMERGIEADPAVYMESVHYVKKMVAGAPNIRPPWFFETTEQGEGLNDVGTHLVDLVQWTLFPDQALDYRADISVLTARRWPTSIAEADFRSVTNVPRFPENLAASVRDGKLEYYCNTLVSYTIRGIHTKLNVIWEWEPPAGGGDTHFACYRGTRSRVEVRQAHEDRLQPELYVVPSGAELRAEVLAALQVRISAMQAEYADVSIEDRGAEFRITIPDSFRVGHEAHFAHVTRSFLEYLDDRTRLPAWERPNMLAKYYVTTAGTELSRQAPSKVAPRLTPVIS